jgi:hypothetical protein
MFLDFSKFYKHTRRMRENKSNMDNTMKKCDTDNWNEMCEHECNVGGNTYSPKLRLLA